MRRTIRKTSAGLYVAYEAGGTNSLRGQAFELDVNEKAITLSIDLSANLRTRNKRGHSYIDAIDLSERHSSLAYIDLTGVPVSEPLAWAREHAPCAALFLRLLLDRFGEFRYRVHSEMQDRTVRLVVDRAQQQ